MVSREREKGQFDTCIQIQHNSTFSSMLRDEKIRFNSKTDEGKKMSKLSTPEFHCSDLVLEMASRLMRFGWKKYSTKTEKKKKTHPKNLFSNMFNLVHRYNSHFFLNRSISRVHERDTGASGNDRPVFLFCLFQNYFL